MFNVSVYEDFAQEFLTAHPFGSVVSGAGIQTWIAQHTDGAIIKGDLNIEDPSKRLTTLRRHLNDGGRSSNMAEDRRFILDVEDAKSKTYVVRPYSEVVEITAREAIGKSVTQALSPLRAGRRAIDSVKLDELPEINRKALEMARENIDAMERAVKPTLAQEVDRIWIAELGRRGIPADQALKIREALPQVRKLQKLLYATA